MSVIGVDFGNSECVIAQAKRGGIDIILNENSNRKNPTLVSLQGKQRFMGEAAVPLARSNQKNTVSEIKRLIGRKFHEPEVQQEIAKLPYKCVELPTGDVGIELLYNDEQVVFSCEKVVAMMLGKLKAIAEQANPGVRASDIVIGVPGWWSDSQRRAMLNASSIAGLNTLRLMNENTAVALAYGIYKSARKLFHETEPQYVMFIDLGHSCYTVSIVAFVQGKLQVKSVAYDRNLGGRDFDYALYLLMAKMFFEKTKLDVTSDKKATGKLLAAAERTKKSLSPQGVTACHFSVECLKDDRDFEGNIDLPQFEAAISPLVERLEKPILDALAEAGIEKGQLANVEVVGGGVRVPAVKAKLASVLGLNASATNFGLSTTLNADESVARGCALQCAIISPLFKVKDFSIVDRLQYPIKLSWEQVAAPMDIGEHDEDVLDGKNDVVIFERGDDYPKVRRVTFVRKNAFDVCATYDAAAETLLPGAHPVDLGKYKITGIPTSGLEDSPKIRVNLKEDIHGIFSVSSAQLMQPIPEEAPKTDDTAKAPAENAAAGTAETAPAEGAAPAAAAEPKKTKYKKVDLVVESFVPGLSQKEILEGIENEAQMAHQDRIIQETADMRNELETYIYSTRNELSDKLRDYVLDKERMSFDDKLTAMEDWLYSDEGFDAAKNVFRGKLDELKKLGDPIYLRFREASERQVAAGELTSLLDTYEQLAQQARSSPKYEHLTDEEWKKIKDECAGVRNWLYDEIAVQGERKPHEDPILTSAIIRDRKVKLDQACRPIINKPKPKPAAEPEKPAPEEPKPTPEDAKKPNAEQGAAPDDDFLMGDADGQKKPQKTDDELAEDVQGDKMDLD